MRGLARVLGAVFLPQQHQRHAFASQLLVHAAVFGLHKAAGSLGCAQQSAGQSGVVQQLNVIPVQPCRCDQREVLADDALGDVQRGGGVLVGEPGFKLETQYVSYLAHIDPSGIGYAYIQQSC